MAPMRGERGGSPARAARASLPLSRRLIRQIARHVASSGRSLRRLEVSGRVIDNFDDIDNVTDDDEDMNDAQTAAVACAGNSGNLPPPEHDDDLTSLSWLQDRNLLRGINLTKGDEQQDNKMIESPIIIKTEPSTTPPPPVARVPSPPRTPCKSPATPPAPVLAHTKPPYSFSCLIFMAIEAAPTRALPVKEIYAWIIRHFPYFKNAPQGWKNSVRHNLSLNKCFHKQVAYSPGFGKGSLWTVDPQHRATLLQRSFSACEGFQTDDSPAKIPLVGLETFGRQPIPPAPPDIPSPIKNSPDSQLFPKNSPEPQLFSKSSPEPQLFPKNFPEPQLFPKNAPDSQLFLKYSSDPPLFLKNSPDPQLFPKTSPESQQLFPKNSPDPQLFPFLARRLAGDTKPPPETPGADEYLAAATVLAMKYGSRYLDQLPPAAHLVISRCTRDEHSYSGCEERRTAEALLNLAGITPDNTTAALATS